MHPRELKWSKSEKETARRAFDAAYQRECAEIRSKLRELVDGVSEPRDLWRIHDYLTERRDETDEKYDYRYSVLPFVFARLLRDGWLSEAELEGLRDDKMEVVNRLVALSA
jgi:hypothetical protein